MNRRNVFNLSVAVALGLAFLSGAAVSQTKSLKDQLAGTWTLATYENTADDGSKKSVFGPQPIGILMVDASGHYATLLTDPRRPKWKSNLRAATTDEEFATAAKGLIAQFGTWSVDEGTKTFTRKVEGALNPGLPGTEQKFAIAISGDELRLTDMAQSGVTGGKTEATFRRAK